MELTKDLWISSLSLWGGADPSDVKYYLVNEKVQDEEYKYGREAINNRTNVGYYNLDNKELHTNIISKLKLGILFSAWAFLLLVFDFNALLGVIRCICKQIQQEPNNNDDSNEGVARSNIHVRGGSTEDMTINSVLFLEMLISVIMTLLRK